MENVSVERRRMMEIDNTLLAQNIEFDKLGMVISEWETEKAVSALDNRDEERDVDSSDSNRGLDRKDLPDHVQQAWDDLQFKKNQHHRYLEMREDCAADYQECKRKTVAMTESLSGKASSREQRELLHLLTRVYQLEIEKLEMQSSQLIREHELRCRDLMILRYDRQRQLCDEIITRQRILIDSLATGEKAQNVNARRELNELYRIYQQEIQDLSNGRSSDLGHLSPYSGGLYRPNSGGLRPLGSSGSMLELHQLDSNKSSPSLGSHPLPPIASRGENGDQDRRLFERRKPFRRDSDDGHYLPPLAGQPRNGRAFSRFSNSSSNSSSSMNDRRSVSTGSPPDSLTYSNSSSNGRISNSSDPQPQKLKRLEEVEEPLRRRFIPLPSLRQRKGRGTSSDSEVLAYNRTRQLEREVPSQASNRFHPEARKHKMAEERRTKAWGNGKAPMY